MRDASDVVALMALPQLVNYADSTSTSFPASSLLALLRRRGWILSGADQASECVLDIKFVGFFG